jgi:hypothetical protein
MRSAIGITILAGVLLGPSGGGELSAQAPNPSNTSANTAKNPACALLSVAEIRKITGRQDYDHPLHAGGPEEVPAGGWACSYEGPAASFEEPPDIGFALISGQDYTRRHATTKLPPGGRCKRESVKGLGDDAYFECCPCSSRSAPALWVKVGTNDLIIDAEVEPPATEASVRSTMISLARALEAKLRNRQ